MNYAFYEAKIGEKEKRIFGNGNLFYILAVKEDETTITLFLFAKTDGKFRTARIIAENCYTFETNPTDVILRKVLPDSSNYYYNSFHLDNRWDINNVFQSNDENEIKDWADKNNIVLFSNYESDMREIKTEIKNNTRLSNLQIMDIVSNIRIVRITGTKISYSYASGIDCVYDKNRYDPSPQSSEIFIYDNGFSEWKKERIHTDASYCVNYFSTLRNSFAKSHVYVRTTENSISLDKIELSVSCQNDTLTITAEKTFSYDYEIGKPILCKKYMKTKTKDVSGLEMFHINSQTIRNPYDIYTFEGAFNEYDFFIKNEKLLSKCGLFKLLQDYSERVNITSFFILYLCLIQEYNIIELLVKMGHTNLVEDIFLLLYSCGTKDKIAENINNLSQLINKETTKGSLALRLPSYIADYLKMQKESLSNYLFWRDIYEIENISKENFEKFLNMPEKIIISSEVSANKGRWNAINWQDLNIQEIIKYDGYSLNKVFKYVYKITTTNALSRRYRYSIFRDTFDILKDTLTMAEELGFELEPYPDNLYQIHSQLSEVIKERREKIQNEAVEKISVSGQKVIEEALESKSVTLPTKAIEKYTYVIPKNQQEFTQEGQQQHNCVAGYCSRVKNGQCVIFFVREKDSPNDSFVTAEITTRGLGQVMYSNNRRVPYDSLVYQYCKFISRTILKGIEKGDIIALSKLLK